MNHADWGLSRSMFDNPWTGEHKRNHSPRLSVIFSLPGPRHPCPLERLLRQHSLTSLNVELRIFPWRSRVDQLLRSTAWFPIALPKWLFFSSSNLSHGGLVRQFH
ncbi:hypothetical protein BDV25DRAFT_159924 [Aspergillus avenaceus]|uniref:Uncharacterized protein n=1 Tax=Aspergillus avenaceus TaxID=36643 RepID=A0A5N6TND3_ASPAV|nr:hypothetical protein BDV25DRAFT_159924 [Aspergillus avenaceus]